MEWEKGEGRTGEGGAHVRLTSAGSAASSAFTLSTFPSTIQSKMSLSWSATLKEER